MAVFVDLDDDVEPPDPGTHYATEHQVQAAFEKNGLQDLRISDPERRDVEMVNLNRNSTTEVFACYPAVTIITSHIDLNTLDSLSRTCHQIRENLIQFRSQLIHQTLRCSNDDVELDPDHTLRYRARATNWYFVEEDSASSWGKIGHCARDMVAECRRCKTVICRNCATKPPAPILLRHRHRRLCSSCAKLPLPALITPTVITPGPLATDILKRSTCQCATSGTWLCQPCGKGLRSADTTYDSIWRWRTRYGPTLGEGNRSFECGRAQECCAAGFVEEEIDCDAQDARGGDRSGSGADARAMLTTSPTPSIGSGSSDGGRRGVGYSRHEIEGIGGVVKKKLVRMARVGACVGEYEDERCEGRYMVRETDGRARSWCGWCWRVIPGAEDKAEWGL